MSDTGQDEGDNPFQSRADGQLHFEPGTAANTFPVTAPEDPTPLRRTNRRAPSRPARCGP